LLYRVNRVYGRWLLEGLLICSAEAVLRGMLLAHRLSGPSSAGLGAVEGFAFGVEVAAVGVVDDSGSSS